MIESLLAKKATGPASGLLVGVLGPFVSDGLQEVALVAAAFAGAGYLLRKIIIPAGVSLRNSIRAPAQLAELEKKVEARFDQFEAKLDVLLHRSRDGSDDPGP